MPALRYDLSYLKNPEIFRVGRMDAYSDHDVYLTPEEASANATSLQQSLNGLWKFSYTENPADRPEGFWAEGYDVSAWNTIPVPGHIQLNGYGKPQYVNTQYPWDGHEKLTPPAIPEDFNPVGSYVRTFEVPASWLDMRVVLTFHGVETAFYCWVNGQFMGYSEDSFTPSRFDITSALKPGVNTVAVEVFRFSTATWLEDQDFWRFSGIMRDVTLNAFPAAHVHDLFVHADMDGSLKVDYKLDLPEGKDITLEMKLLAACGCVVDSVSVPAKAEMTIDTLAGVLAIRLDIEEGRAVAATVDMGEPCFDPARIPVNAPSNRITVELDGKRMGNASLAPYTVDLGHLSSGTHTLDITVYASRINTFGVLHMTDYTTLWIGPKEWHTENEDWSYEYRITPTGLLTAPRLYLR